MAIRKRIPIRTVSAFGASASFFISPNSYTLGLDAFVESHLFGVGTSAVCTRCDRPGRRAGCVMVRKDAI